MLSAGVGVASGLSGVISSSIFTCCRGLTTASSKLVNTAVQLQSQPRYHTQTQEFQDFASSCRIPSPAVPEVLGDVRLREGLSSVDGPGLRYLVALPSDELPSHDVPEGGLVSSKTIANELCQLRPYLVNESGGVSVAAHSLTQQDFCVSVFKEAHALNLTTCLQTTAHGAATHELDRVLPHTDVVGLEVRPMHYPSDVFNGTQEWGLEEYAYLSHHLHAHAIPHYLRYVLVPGVTDQPHDIKMLVEISKMLKPHLQGVQLLPYHVLGGTRWRSMGYSQLFNSKIKPFKIEMVNDLVKQMSSQGLQVSLNLKTS